MPLKEQGMVLPPAALPPLVQGHQLERRKAGKESTFILLHSLPVVFFSLSLPAPSPRVWTRAKMGLELAWRI